MRIADQIKETVFIQGRGRIRLLDVMKEAGVSHNEIGFPDRWYRRPVGIALICGQAFQPREVIELDLGEGQPPRVASRETIPYVTTRMALYSYQKGILRPYWSRGKERAPVWPDGEKIIAVLGRGADSEYLRVRLPHKPEEWLLPETAAKWLDRIPNKLELRLQEIWLDNPFDPKDRHPLWAADYLLEQARKERWLTTSEGDLFGALAVEEWEELREAEGLSVDEALIAVRDGLIASIEDRGTLYYSGPFHGEHVQQYIKASWHWSASSEVLRQMADLHTVEREMLRGAMRAVANTRKLYAWDSVKRIME